MATDYIPVPRECGTLASIGKNAYLIGG